MLLANIYSNILVDIFGTDIIFSGRSCVSQAVAGPYRLHLYGAWQRDQVSGYVNTSIRKPIENICRYRRFSRGFLQQLCYEQNGWVWKRPDLVDYVAGSAWFVTLLSVPAV